MSIIQNQTVVTIDLQLHTEDGRLVQNLKDHTYIHGINDILPGMYTSLLGKEVGDTIQAVLPSDEAFGDIQNCTPIIYTRWEHRKLFNQLLYIGMDIVVEGEKNEDGSDKKLYIKALTTNSMTLTTNHPLAGCPIRFETTIVTVRAATTEELEKCRPINIDHSSCSCC
jgi:FKBP-type peptidyl-prolyl cis-trans isomerase SlyD